jgi:predicted DNA-binding transcriptional regulator YafY
MAREGLVSHKHTVLSVTGQTFHVQFPVYLGTSTPFAPRFRMLKVSPLDRLRQLLQAGAQLTYADLRHHTNLGDKQVSRLLDQLRAEGLPITESRRGRLKVFELPPERQQVAVPDLRFDNDELRALAVAAKASRAALTGTPHAGALQRAFDQLLAHARPVTYLFDVDEPQQEWFFDDTPADLIAIDSFRQLEAAMDERQPVLLDYYTGSTGQQWHGRRIDPYAFIKRQRTWLLVGYCHKRQRVQHFALTRISQVVRCPDEHYELQAGFSAENYFSATLGTFASGGTYELRLLVEPDRALHFRERKYHHNQQIEEERPDGRLVVSFELEGLDEMRSFCQSWGTGITVLAPIELRERLRQEAETLAARYQSLT